VARGFHIAIAAICPPSDDDDDDDDDDDFNSSVCATAKSLGNPVTSTVEACLLDPNVDVIDFDVASPNSSTTWSLLAAVLATSGTTKAIITSSSTLLKLKLDADFVSKWTPKSSSTEAHTGEGVSTPPLPLVLERLVCVIEPFAYKPGLKCVIDILNQGAVGTNFSYSWDLRKTIEDGSWEKDNVSFVHMVRGLRHLFGEVVSVQTKDGGGEEDKRCTVTFTYGTATCERTVHAQRDMRPTEVEPGPCQVAG
jgi:hypothetical protein